MRVPLAIALRQPLNLAVLALAVGSGLSIGLWLLPLGLVVYAGLVWLSQRDLDLFVRLSAPKPAELPRGTIFDAQLKAIKRSQEDIAAAINEAEPALQQGLVRVTEQVDEIVAQALELANKGQLLVEHLGRIDRHAILAQLTRTEEQLKTTTDAGLHRQYIETRNALQQQLTTCDNLANYRDRILAQLDSIVATLSATLNQTVLLRTAGKLDTDTTIDAVSHDLTDLRTDMQVFGQVLETAVARIG